jgi:hypothetical protein
MSIVEVAFAKGPDAVPEVAAHVNMFDSHAHFFFFLVRRGGAGGECEGSLEIWMREEGTKRRGVLSMGG